MGVEKLRVMQLIKTLSNSGGAERLLLENFRFFDKSSFDFSYGYFFCGANELAPLLEAGGAVTHCFDARDNSQLLLSLGSVVSFVRRWNPHVIHCHLPLVGVLGRMVGRLTGVPVVYTEHNVWERYHPLTRFSSALTWGLQRKVIAVSAEVADSVRRCAPSGVPLEIIMNGVDTDHFARDTESGAGIKRELGIPVSAPVVGNVASFKTEKRLDRWLASAANVLITRPDAHFILIGDGPLRTELQASASRAPWGSHIHFVGVTADVRPYLSAMDIFMMSSDFEGLPIALLEAMAAECAIVSTRAGGIPEALENGVDGMLASNNGAQELAHLVVDLLGLHSMRRELGRNARAKVIKEFGMRQMTNQLEHVYRTVGSGEGNWKGHTF